MGKRILVADDSQTIQTAFAMVLGAEHTLVPARSLDEAVSAAKSGRPDLVLADAALGNASGYDLCAALKADPVFRAVPIHILTSNQNPYDEGRAGRAGADGFIVKPFDSQALMDNVAAALSAPTKSSVAAPPSAAAVRPLAEPTFAVAPDAAAEDDDAYGEITIERAPTAPSPAAWASRPATRPSGARPVVPTPVTSPVPGTVVTRPSLIPGTRPSASGIPVARPAAPGIVPAPAVPPAATSPVPRSMANRTIMGFPAVAGGASPGAPIPPVVRPPASTRTPAPPTVPTPAVPPRVPPAAPPRVAPAPVPTIPVAQTAPVAPGMAPWRPVSPPTSAPAVPVPTPVSAPARPTPPPPTVAAVVASAVDAKMAALAARGPEYEAIAKLSREIIEQVVWEVVPELAELIIKQEVDRLAGAKR